MLLGADARSPSIAIVDLATFEYDKKSVGAVVDYYFQLKRAVPQVDPYFVFLHELADERSESFRLLLQRLEQLLAAE
jgi:hypothetical protein